VRVRAPGRHGRFDRSLAVIAGLGLLVRLVYVLGFRRDLTLTGDAFFYHQGAILLAHGNGFVAPVQYLALHTRLEAADHPPLYMLFLAIPSVVGVTSTLAHLLWSACLGTATVVVAGLLGRRVGGARAGLITAAIVAVSPTVWIYDGEGLSETMAIFVVTVTLLLAYRAWERPSLGRACALGAACGFAMLARSELLLLVPAVVWPVTMLAGRAPWRTRLVRGGAATLVALLVVGPWLGYNLARFHHPVFLSSQLEVTLAGANCNDTYSGENIGLFTQTCFAHDPGNERQEESDHAQALRHIADHFIRTHAEQLPAVAAARVGRVLGVYHVGQQLGLDVYLERRERPLAIAVLVCGYLLGLAAIAGVVIVRRRRGPPVFPLVAVLAVTLLTVAATYGNNRFRASGETALAVLAAVAIEAAWRLLRTAKPRPSSPADTRAERPMTAVGAGV
jgi:4-amino-4-deoxy-L-arabinose transferase-like glycosyltransferase